jgi:hypothetical protein
VVSGANFGQTFELPHLGRMRHENALVNPFPQVQTIVAQTDDIVAGGQVYFYVGQKRDTGLEVERAGLVGGELFGLAIEGLAAEVRDAPPAAGTRFRLANLHDVSTRSGPQLDALSDAAGVTKFLGPEDGHWDPRNPNRFYFVTTDRYDEVKDRVGSQVGRSRLYAAEFDDITNPLGGGTITALLDGSELVPGLITGPNQFDNMTATIGAGGSTVLLLQEDVSGEDHNSKIWLYDVATDGLTLLALHDQARFGDIGRAPTAPFNNDEESSGIIDAGHVLGPGWFLLTDQPHYAIGGQLVTAGQLLAMYVPQAVPPVPEPGTWALAAAGMGAAVAAARRRKRRE